MRTLALPIALAALTCGAAAQEADPRAPFLHWMDRIAQEHLDHRAAELARIRDVPGAERRRAYTRAKILELMGGLPDYSGPLNGRTTGTISKGSYVIEKVVFDSLPKFPVTGNLYRPSAAGRYPAVLMPMGHWEEGKPAGQRIAANLAMKGFVVLSYDPVGQGERWQAFDARTGQSLAGGATEQHFMNGAQSLLAGQSFARYRVWDARRALDYLLSRPEVDADRVGCTGCSGGGTLTTYIAALDPRIKVAAPACYMNTYRKLFTGPTGDSEQALPDFLSAGLDLGDYVELFAPKPYLIINTIDDFFPLEGARQAYEEARGWYRLFGAEDKIRWAVGPGGHGTPREVREELYAWMIRWLRDGQGDRTEQAVEMEPAVKLLATASGQVATEYGARDLAAIIAETPRKPGSAAELLAFVKKLMPPEPGEHVRARVVEEKSTAESIARQVRFETERGLEIGGTILIPRRERKMPAVVLVDTRAEVPPLAHELAGAGAVVFALAPRGLPTNASRVLSGDWITNCRAWLIGRNLPGMRAYDIRRGVDIVAAMPEVDPARISVAAGEAAGVWALLAAAADRRIANLWLDRTPATLASAMSTPVHRNLHDAVMPGFWLHWDLPDLVKALGGRRVIWTDPTDWNRNVIALAGAYEYRGFEERNQRMIGMLLGE